MKTIVSFLLICLVILPGKAQNILEGNGNEARGDLRLMFYNVENCFDCFNDSLTADEEFLPQGTHHWTWDKYKRKTAKIAKVIMAAGGWEFPDLIGMCEIENHFVLDGIFHTTSLQKIDYRIIHRESPDHRGIDVALIYQSEVFHPIDTAFIKVKYANREKSTTREILYAKGKLRGGDTLHVFVNHWPSRWGGQLESEHKRFTAAGILRAKLDSIFQKSPHANVIIMGDFNDYPDNESIRTILQAKKPEPEIQDSIIYNLATKFVKNGSIGSHKYHGKWGMLDQFMVSGSLLQPSSQLYCQPNGMSVFAPDFLLEKDESYFGVKPFRTFVGYKYHGGFSDHLPVVLDLWRR